MIDFLNTRYGFCALAFNIRDSAAQSRQPARRTGDNG